MTWRGSTTGWDRFFACLPYLLPLMDSLVFSTPLFERLPELQVILIPLAPFLFVYTTILGAISFGGVGLGGLLLFFALFMLVVRNERIRHFIRFNTMQSIIIGIVLSLFSIIWSYVLEPVLRNSLIAETLFTVMFLGTVAATVYCIVQSALGRYAEIPTLSDAAYIQVR
jgi:uncharacterized membrane protein